MGDGFFSRLPLYLGGFMGPFGTVVIVPMFPELREEFGASQGAVGWGFSLYLLVFAVSLLFSGTLGERWGRRRTVRGTFLVYSVASIAAALAPTLGVFLAARAAQGVANAFITPLLIAGLAELVPENKLGREVGIYASFQAAGSGLGPVIGGVAADTSWQLAYWGAAVVAALLALRPPPGAPRPAAKAPPVRPLLTPQMIGLGAAFLFAAAGPVGIGTLVGPLGRDVLELSGTATGLALFAGSAAALVLGPIWGRLLDRIGLRNHLLGFIAASALIAGIPSLASGPWSLGALYVGTAAVTSAVVVSYQSLGATLVPDNRGGALSFLLAFRFVGHAIGPLVFFPLIVPSTARTAFFGAAALGLVTLVLVAAFLRVPQAVND